MCLGDAFTDEEMAWSDDMDEPGPRSVSTVDLPFPLAQARVIGRTRNAWAKQQGVTALLAQQFKPTGPRSRMQLTTDTVLAGDAVFTSGPQVQAANVTIKPKDVNLKNAIRPNLSIVRSTELPELGICQMEDHKTLWCSQALTSIVRIAATSYCGCPCYKRHIPDGCRLQRV